MIDVTSKKVKWSFVGGPFGSNLKASDYTDSGIRIIQLQNIGDAEFIDDYKIFTSEQKANELLSCNIYPGDIILSKMGDPVARACLIPSNHQRYVMCSDGIRLVVDEKKYNKFFIYSFINSAQFRRRAEKVATGSTRKRIGLDQLKNLPVIIPEFDEQQKIAACLNSLDDLITAHTHKLTALRTYKQGLLQHLFPAEGATLPRLRFPEFQHAPEWEIRQLGDLLLSSPDYGVNAPAVPYSEDLPAYLRITDISDEGHYLRDKKVSVDIDARDENYLSEGDIVLARTGASVGKSYKYRKEDGKLVFAGYLIRVKPDQKSIDSTFLFNFLSTRQYWNWVDVISMRSGQPGINASEYATLSIPVPPTRNEGELSEQQKIANCLTALDDLIAAQTQKIAALTAHKKGLLQQLFPSPEEL